MAAAQTVARRGGGARRDRGRRGGRRDRAGGRRAAAAYGSSDAMLTGAGGVRLDTSYFTAGGAGRRPAVLLAHGFGGSKDDVRGQAEKLARHGYAVLTWSARGFGRSGGQIGLNAPDGEVADVGRLVDWLARQPRGAARRARRPAGRRLRGLVRRRGSRCWPPATTAGSTPSRPAMTYWNLADALFPDGVYKKLWAGIFFSGGSPGERLGSAAPGATAVRLPPPVRPAPRRGPRARPRRATRSAAASTPAVCALYKRVAVAGTPGRRGPRAARRAQPVGGREPDQGARADRAGPDRLAVHPRPVRRDGQGDQGQRRTRVGRLDRRRPRRRRHRDARVDGRVTAWFDRYLKGDTSTRTGPAFRVTRTGGLNSTDGSVRAARRERARVPRPRRRRRPADRARRRAAAHHQPGRRRTARDLRGARRRRPDPALPLGAGRGLSAGLPRPVRAVRLRAAAPLHHPHRRPHGHRRGRHRRTATRCSSPSSTTSARTAGRRCRRGLATPVRVDRIAAGRHGDDPRCPPSTTTSPRATGMRLVLATTDLGYASPAAPASYTVSLAGPALTVPADADAAHGRRRAAVVGVGAAAGRRWRWPRRCCSPAAAGSGPARPTRRWPTCRCRSRAEQAVREVRRPVRRARPVLPGRAGPGARPARAQRRGQDHHAADADGPDPPGRGRDPGVRRGGAARRAGAVPGRARSWRAPASCRT